VVALGIGVWLVVDPGRTAVFPVLIALSLIFGTFLVVRIGGADMPTVISLLNSYAGLSAAAMGFVLENPLLIIAGALGGSSGFILSVIMCRAMNRSFSNVLFGGFGAVRAEAATGAIEERPVRSATPEEAAMLLETARDVIIVPGFGLAVAQAQHKIRELADVLERAGCRVRYAIHPVAGRMPGHMNVLLAEADVSYDRIFDMADINSDFAQCDVALVVGANDVTNPAAKTQKDSPIYGMPVLDVGAAGTVMVIKRSMKPGFAGVENELYFQDKTLVLFGDAKHVADGLLRELESTVPV
jgi:NAD(P) transhydrogenase subunit beta